MRINRFLLVAFWGFPNFANKTFANWTFANGESPVIYWRKYSGHLPIGESQEGILVKV